MCARSGCPHPSAPSRAPPADSVPPRPGPSAARRRGMACRFCRPARSWHSLRLIRSTKLIWRPGRAMRDHDFRRYAVMYHPTSMNRRSLIMAEDPDDLPRRPSAKPPDLTTWSVEELEAYINRLEGEIARARAQIEARRSVRGAAEALFKKG